MGSLSDIRFEIKALLEGVPDIGVVHDYERWAADEKRVKDLFQDPTTGGIRAWTITREATPSSDHDSEREARQHQWVVRGFLGLKDAEASEKTFEDLVESVCAALRAERMKPAPLNGRAHVVGPISVRRQGPWMLPAGILCHMAEIVVATTVLE